MRLVVNADRVRTVVEDALTVRGTVATLPHIGGGLAVRVTGRTNRNLALRALALAGYGPITHDETHGILHIPA